MSDNRILHRKRGIVVWLLRIIVGATFIFSGFSKAVDPWGFMYKLQEYLMTWNLAFIPREAVLCSGAALSLFEFTLGVAIITGTWRRISAWLSLLFMCFMLPLSLYIWIESPVDDCGCFGEAWILPNWATFLKNAVIIVLTILLVKWNASIAGLYRIHTEWTVVFFSILYCIVLLVVGYIYQPMFDFRPYKVNSAITEDSGDSKMRLIYEKDGLTKSFSIDSLPDDTWTYVSREEKNDKVSKKLLAVYDDNEDVTSDVFQTEGPQILLIVSNPAYHTRARAGMANRINEYIEKNGGTMTALVALPSQSLSGWKNLANPDYEVYSVEDTSLKELARGDAALVYLENGIIKWKRNLYFISSEFPNKDFDGNALEDVFIPDSGKPLMWLSIAYLILLLLPLVAKIPIHRHRYKKIKGNI